MAQLNMVQAFNQALAEEMARDDRVVLLGEDVGRDGGVFRVTEGLQERFGAERGIDTPLSESCIIGAAIGMAAYGLRPVPEIQFLGFTYSAFDQLFAHAARLEMRVNLTTNGTLLDKAKARALVELPARSITLSVDSPIARLHDEVRGRAGAFGKTRGAIDQPSGRSPAAACRASLMTTASYQPSQERSQASTRLPTWMPDNRVVAARRTSPGLIAWRCAFSHSASNHGQKLETVARPLMTSPRNAST